MKTPQQSQYQPPVMPQSITPQLARKPYLVPLITVPVLVGGYFALAKYQSMWPFSTQMTTESSSPTPNISPSLSPDVSQNPVSDLQTFNSKYFNVSFKYPRGYEVYDSQNYIAVYTTLENLDRYIRWNSGIIAV